MVGISTNDITDSDINDSVEQLSDGYKIYNTGIISTCNTLTKIITIIPLSNFDNLINGDNCIQIKDKVYIYNSTNADGYYTINTIINSTQFTVLENISNSINGNILYMHPSGSSKIGFDNSKSKNITKKTVQEALEQLDIKINKKNIIINFVLPESISGKQEWYYVSNWPGKFPENSRSGNDNGIESQENCVPYLIPFTGIITKCICILKSSGTATSSVIYPVNFINRLQLVTFYSVSTLFDIIIPISDNYIVGNNRLKNTDFNVIKIY